MSTIPEGPTPLMDVRLFEVHCRPCGKGGQMTARTLSTFPAEHMRCAEVSELLSIEVPLAALDEREDRHKYAVGERVECGKGWDLIHDEAMRVKRRVYANVFLTERTETTCTLTAWTMPFDFPHGPQWTEPEPDDSIVGDEPHAFEAPPGETAGEPSCVRCGRHRYEDGFEHTDDLIGSDGG